MRAPRQADRALSPSATEPVPVSSPDGVTIAGADDDPYWEFDDHECGNCGGEGFTYGCSWDWQCDTYDAGEGTCLCTRRCDWCNPAPPSPETEQLRQVLREALAQGGVTRTGGDLFQVSVAEGDSTRSSEAGCALSPSNPSSPTTTKRG